MADLDFGEIRLYPGSYDDYMTASTMVTEQLQADNARKQAKITELKAFVSRFSANASKSKQATSRARQLEKIDLTEIKPSSRKNPFIRFEQNKKLHRLALEIEGLTKSYEQTLFKQFDLMVQVGERIAIIGPNGIGKTTLLKCMAGETEPNSGAVKWSENSDIGYCAQDHAADFVDDKPLFDWMEQRGVAIFAKACFGHSSPSKRQKLNATANAFGAPIRPRHLVPTQQGVGTLAPNDLTPCRMAFYFVYTYASATIPTKQRPYAFWGLPALAFALHGWQRLLKYSVHAPYPPLKLYLSSMANLSGLPFQSSASAGGSLTSVITGHN